MIEVTVRFYEPFYNFMKEYLAYFGSEQTVEELCRMMIYESVKFLYKELEEFAYANSFRHIEKGSWFKKWPHISTVSFEEDKEEKDC